MEPMCFDSIHIETIQMESIGFHVFFLAHYCAAMEKDAKEKEAFEQLKSQADKAEFRRRWADKTFQKLVALLVCMYLCICLSTYVPISIYLSIDLPLSP